MRVIDAHQHLGTCRVFDAEVTEQGLIDALDREKVELALVMPFPGAPDTVESHDEIVRAGERHPGRIRGIVNINPHRSHGEYRELAEHYVKEHGFVALKLHTVGHAVDPLSCDGRLVCDTATRLGVPMIVHTGGIGEPFASPSHCLPLAREFPDTSIVLAHAGGGVGTREAGVVATECDNVWLETSWCSVLDVLDLLKVVGPGRVMLGSDAVENIGIELAKYRALRLANADLARCLGGTAAAVFKL